MFLSKYKLFIPESKNDLTTESISIANGVMVELMHYGISPDIKIIERLMHMSPENSREVAEAILKKYSIGDVNPPLFPDWENRTRFTFTEFTVQILTYIFQISGNDLADANYMQELRQNVAWRNLKQLELATVEETEHFFLHLINTKQSKQQQETLFTFAKYFPVATFIRSDEARIAVYLATGIDAMLNSKGKPADILRFFAARTDITQVNLPANIIYDKMKWQERKKSLAWLKDYRSEFLFESMGFNRNAWVRFFRHIHLFQQQELMRKYHRVAAIAWISAGNKLAAAPSDIVRDIEVFIKRGIVETTPEGALAYRTFASRVQSAIEQKSWKKLKPLLSKKPSYLLRNLATVANAIKPKKEADFVAFCKNAVGKANSDVLFSLIQINTKATHRIIDVKGTTHVTEANYSKVIRKVQKVAKKELKTRFGIKGTITVPKNIENDVVPFLARNQELHRGTRIKIEKDFFYFFMHWVQADNRRTDLDHSWLMFSKGGRTETVAFYNSANNYIAQSGDITNAPAPKGGTEYSCVRMSEVPNGIKYMVPCINVYSGDDFKNLPEAYAGYQFSDAENFSLQRKHTRYDLVQPARANIPFVIDVFNQEVIIVDYNIKGNDYGTNIANEFTPIIEDVISASTALKPMTLKKFAKLLSGKSSKVEYRIKTTPKTDKDISPMGLSELIK